MSEDKEQPQPPSQISDNTRVWLDSLAANHPNLATDHIRTACALVEKQCPDLIDKGLDIASELSIITEDGQTLAAAILYPCVNRLKISNAKLKSYFSAGICRLLDGIKKIDAIHSAKDNDGKDGQYQEKIDKLRKMLLAMVDDIRIVLIKLAERVITLKMIKNDDDDNRKTVARQVMTVYAPLANRLGIGHLKWQLEDLAFRYLQWDTYKDISKALNMRRTERENFIQRVMNKLNELLATVHIDDAEISGRAKHIFSIYRKLQRKQVDISEIYDASAVRILVDNLEDCYTVLGLVHGAWQHIAKEFDDYIANPKANGYRSIHTAVIGPGEHNIEIQIRTKAMHEEAELGVAAHWVYKEGKSQESSYEKKISWLRQVMDWQQELSDTDEADSQLFHDTFDDQVYVFTPNGDVIDLTAGATALDFAYHIHTDVGNRCRGAHINKKLSPLTTVLKTGDTVDIITTKNGTPSRDWIRPQLGYLKTHRAIQKVKHYFRRQEFKAKLQTGIELWDKVRRQHHASRQDLDRVAKQLNFKTTDDLLAAIGDGEVTIKSVLQKLAPEQIKSDSPLKLTLTKSTKSASGFVIEGETDLLTHIAQCCKPIPGDEIWGFITRGRGITVHKASCKNLNYMMKETGERIIHVDWGNSSGQYPVDIIVHAKTTADNELVRDIVSAIANLGNKLSALQTNHAKNKDEVSLHMTVIIDGKDNLRKLIAQLQQLPNIVSVERV